MIVVRLARMSEISDILAFVKDALTRTNYAGFHFNAVVARRTVKAAMLDRDSRVWVTEDDGAIKGVLVGEIGAMPMTHHMGASDLCFLADAGGDLLVDAFLAWCKLRGVARVDMGISAGVGREKAIARMFRRKGMTLSGQMFHVNLLGDGP